MMLKKLFLLTFASASLFGAASAQTLTFGPEVGLSLNNFIHNQNNTVSKQVPGLKAGINVNVPIGKKSFINLGAFYLQRGGTLNNASLSQREIYELHYVMAPFMYMHRFKLNNTRSGSFYLGAGPYLSYGFAGRDKLYRETSGSEVEIANQRVSWGSSAQQLQPLEFGVSALAKYEFPFNYYIKLQYLFGCSNITNTDITRIYHQNLQLSVGVNIWTWIK